MSHIHNLLESHSDWGAVELIYHKLIAHGYKAFLAGGCVRDALLGRPANDLDVATDASPEQIEALFEKTVNVGKAFGVIRVLELGRDIEVATFRTDGRYVDGRRPEGVQFSSPEADAERRDFTINALFYDLRTHDIMDFVGGLEDLRHKIIRTVGEAEQRFTEDHLRLLRAVRFVSQLNFPLEEKTFAAMQRMAPLVKSVSGERIRDEMCKLLKGVAVERSLQVMAESGLMQVLFPFRLRNNLWLNPVPTQESWQLLALFFREASASELAEALKLLKLSSKEQRGILKAWDVWNNSAQFFDLPLGKILQLLPEEGIRWGLKILLHERSLWTEKIQTIQAEWQSWDEKLPKPFLGGEDLKGKISGKALGHCLSTAFELQLERKISDREAALLWLQTYLQKDTHG